MNDWSEFAKNVYLQKYAMVLPDGTKETWEQTAQRVAEAVMTSAAPWDRAYVEQLIRDRKFLPGGRYLYASGRPYHQTQNCLLLRAEDSSADWADLMYKVTAGLMSGAGVGVDYSALRHEGAPLRTKGGFSTGPLALMAMVNEAGRHIMQGGARRAALWAGLRWDHPDVMKFIAVKDWSPAIRAAKEADFNFPAPLDGTNVSVILDRDFFAAYAAGDERARAVYWAAVAAMLRHGEPGFSVDYDNARESLRNAPVAGDTRVLTAHGHEFVRDIVGENVAVWTGQRWARTTFKETNSDSRLHAVHMSNGEVINCSPEHPFILVDGATRPRADALRVGDALKSVDPNEVTWVTGTHPLPYRGPVYCCDVGFEEHSFAANGVLISNCTEITSEDDSDICNLGSINLARIDTVEEFAEAVRLGTVFLLAGTLYSDLPYPKVGDVRARNRRLGLGLMGVHEWLLKRGFTYGPNAELARWLEVYAEVSRKTADDCAAAWGITRPVKVRSVAPTGSIGIIAETTTGIEPVFCVAYRRRYRGPDGSSTRFEYVVDPTAKRLIESGVAPAQVEDAYDLAANVERRVEFQAWVQQYVDHGISSTINLPPWGSDLNNEGTVQQFGDMLLRYLPRLRGITVYPDGARGGQPLTRVQYDTAMKHVGQVFVEQQDTCELNGSGTCGA